MRDGLLFADSGVECLGNAARRLMGGFLDT